MKIKKSDFEVLKRDIENLLSDKPEVKGKYREAGLSITRFRWDCISATRSIFTLNLYDYLNDDHINTALKNIISDY